METRVRQIVLGLIIVGILLVGFRPNFISASTEDLIYPPTSSPVDVPYKEWGKKFWQWWLSVPAQISPFPDPKKIDYKCFVGVGDHVVFLADPMITAQTPDLTVQLHYTRRSQCIDFRDH